MDDKTISDSKLQISSLCSIRIRSRKKIIFEKMIYGFLVFHIFEPSESSKTDYLTI